MVGLYQSDDFICGGVLISSNWVATAAHCVYKSGDAGSATAYDARYYKVVIGEATHYSTATAATSAGASVYGISSVTINSEYDSSSYDSDIALLELKKPYYQPGPALATSSCFTDIEEGDYLTVIGYGSTSAGQNDVPDTLQKAEIPYIPTSECYWENTSDTDVTDNMFCAGYTGTDSSTDSCYGDSGGPVFTALDGELTLVGLVSWGASDCSGVPGVYTKISALRDWILENIDGLQVVEQGSASYNSDTASFSGGQISVYHYGSNSNTDSSVSIGSLNLPDEDILRISDGCSGDTLYEIEGSEDDCRIDFALTDVIADDDEFTATLSVTPSTSAGEQSYDLKFVADLTTDEELSFSAHNSSSDSSSDSSSYSSGGSLGFAPLLCLFLLACWRVGAANFLKIAEQ